MADEMLKNAQPQELESQIGEEDGLKEQLLRMCRQNKLAAFSAVLILVVILMAIFAPVLAPYGEAEQDLISRLQGPSAAHWFGTDELGPRCVLPYSVWLAPLAYHRHSAQHHLAGGGHLLWPAGRLLWRLGGLCHHAPGGYHAVHPVPAAGHGGYVHPGPVHRQPVYRAFPHQLASVARVVARQTLSLKESRYVEAARSIGVSNGKIMLKHILPNCIPSLIVLFTLNVPSAILSESSLSFLGIGAQPPAASWGLWINQSKQFCSPSPGWPWHPALPL